MNEEKQIIKCGFCKKVIEHTKMFKSEKKKFEHTIRTLANDRVRILICPYCKSFLGCY